MPKARSDAVTDAGWDFWFWFAVLSPLIGAVLGVLVPLLIYH